MVEGGIEVFGHQCRDFLVGELFGEDVYRSLEALEILVLECFIDCDERNQRTVQLRASLSAEFPWAVSKVDSGGFPSVTLLAPSITNLVRSTVHSL